MPQEIHIAAIQMNATPADLTQRLERAEHLIEDATGDGVQLVVLPELFNTGYVYDDHNYTLPEPIDGPTVSWMKAMASRYGVHLAGSLYLLDGREVYNSQILIAPDGRRWRYDKNYPYAFERAYYRDGTDVMIADTDLGKIGMMICWDYSHPEIWQRYAGQVDLMVITSSPPSMHRFSMVMPNNHKVDSRALGPLVNRGYTGEAPFGPDLDAQVGWLGVPAVNTSATGIFRSKLPRPRLAAAVYLALRPDLWRFIGRGDEIEMLATYYPQTKIIGADGAVLARAGDEEGVISGKVTLADTTPSLPTAPQPEIPFSNAAYFFIDILAPALMEAQYREGVRQQFGNRMAPFQRSIRWSLVLGLGVVGLLAALIRGIGQLMGGKKGNR